MRTLVVNVGSSSLKLSVVDDGAATATETLAHTGGMLDRRAIEEVVERHRPIHAVGHRIVHGGPTFTKPVLIDNLVRAELDLLVDLAPLHLPLSLAAVDLVSSLLPEAPAVASFDTAFHATMPAAASTYALPAEWRRRWPLRRFGFHGLSHAWAAHRAAELVGQPVEALRTVTCHLGAGASLAAIAGGISVDTTMGFTPLDGLVMATRPGSLDPGLVLWLEEHVGLPASELATALEHRSGLLGLAGSADMAAVLQAEAAVDDRATLAIGVYCHRLKASLAAMTAALGGLDVVVFTGGVGERSASIRARCTAGLAYLGIQVDRAANAAAQPDADITASGATVRTLVVEAREDLQIAAEVRSVLNGP